MMWLSRSPPEGPANHLSLNQQWYPKVVLEGEAKELRDNLEALGTENRRSQGRSTQYQTRQFRLTCMSNYATFNFISPSTEDVKPKMLAVHGFKK